MEQGIVIRFKGRKTIYVDDLDFDLSEFKKVLELWARKSHFELDKYEMEFLY